MKIAIIDPLGLSYNGDTIKERGLGGSESAVIYMSEALADLDYSVTVYNDCGTSGYFNKVFYYPIYDVTNIDADIVISSRSVVPFIPEGINHPRVKSNLTINAKLKVLWLHDTFCEGDHLVEYLVNIGKIDEIFTLSDFHTNYITNCDHGSRRNFEVLKNKIFQTRNGITKHINWVDIKAKDPNLFVFNASVTKGMIPLVEKIWPKIKTHIPQAKLKVIGGYYRFSEEHGPDAQEIKHTELVDLYGSDIEFTGVIKQSEIAEILAKASYMIYPAAFPETFGISSLEALAYNTPLLTCRFGALEETAIDSACYKLNYAIEPNSLFPNIPVDVQVDAFVNMVFQAYNTPYLHQQKMYACNAVKDICTWDTVALQWKQHFYKKFNLFLPVEEYRKVADINYKVAKVFGRRFSNIENSQIRKAPERDIVVITPVYNAEKYIEKCILSVAQQDYKNFVMYIIDDASTDNTYDIAFKTIESLPEKFKFKIIKNGTNVGAIANQVHVLSKIITRNLFLDDPIVLLLDGDDWLVNDPHIFDMYNNLYAEGAEFTYGSCWSVVDNIPLVAQPYPPEIKANRSYRNYKFNWNMPYTHLRTFAKKLFDEIYLANLKDENGEYFRAGGDGSLFYALIEKADPDKVICIPNIVYNYNDANPLNDYKINGEEQTHNANNILSKANVKKYSVIVPTMWREVNQFVKFLDTLCNNESVGEIIIINNDNTLTPQKLQHPKIRMYDFGRNIYVNPAWNFGVKQAKYNHICIVNDDIVFDTNIFERLQDLITENTGLFGLCPGIDVFNQPPITTKSIDILPWTGQHTYGYGCLFFFNKTIWNEIPKGLNIYFGDNYIFDLQLAKGRQNYIITNMEYYTPFASTTRDENITNGFLERERPIYEMAKLNMTKKKHILIAIPTARYIEPTTFKSIYDLEVPEGYETHFQFFYGYNVDQVRNLIADWIVNKDFDYLFSVDHDISFTPDTLKKLISHDKDIVTGVYRQRNEEEHLEIYDNQFKRLKYANMVNKPLVKIHACGFGCVLLKKQVFVSIPYPHFQYISAINHANTFSEDMFFCNNANAKGFEIWADPSILCDHYGQKVYSVEIPKENDIKLNRFIELSNMPLFPKDHAEYLNKMKIRPRVIYDIGACVGHWTDVAKKVWPTANIYQFEAMLSVEDLYIKKGYNNYFLGVLSDIDGKEVNFYENEEHPGGNSLYVENIQYSPKARELFPESSAKKVKTYTLDSIVSNPDFNFTVPDLIKMDVQGAELEILKGAKNIVKYCNDIIIEMQHVDYNIGAPKFQEVKIYLESIGFEMVEKISKGTTNIDADYHFTRKN